MEETITEEVVEEVAEEPVEEPVIEETVEETIEEPVIEETPVDDDIPTVDKLLSDEPFEDEPVVEETVTEEPVIEETAIEETIPEEPVEETVVDEPAAEENVPFAEVDNLDNSLTASNLAYLDKSAETPASDSIANTELKQDIKQVLLYMDQLLENLPEDKIVEFAKSDEFITYKKLFSELGLS